MRLLYLVMPIISKVFLKFSKVLYGVLDVISFYGVMQESNLLHVIGLEHP